MTPDELREKAEWSREVIAKMDEKADTYTLWATTGNPLIEMMDVYKSGYFDGFHEACRADSLQKDETIAELRRELAKVKEEEGYLKHGGVRPSALQSELNDERTTVLRLRQDLIESAGHWDKLYRETKEKDETIATQRELLTRAWRLLDMVEPNAAITDEIFKHLKP